LHISDLHVNPEMPSVKDNVKIVDLVDHLNTKTEPIRILIFTGDLIDFRYINKKLESCSIDEKYDRSRELMCASYEKAYEYLSYICESLNISPDHRLLCCGNHDMISDEDNAFRVCNGKTESDYSMRFQMFNEFCHKLTARKESFQTHFRRIDGFNFIIANTNWSFIPQAKNQLCISCKEIEKLIDKQKSVLENTRNMHGQRYNIFIAHVPNTNYCETALYPYPENNETSVFKKIREMFGLFCYGDKHTNYYEFTDFIVGAPISSDHITYALYQFNEETNSFSQKDLVFNNGAWTSIESSEVSDRVYSISKQYLKGRGVRFLFSADSLEQIEKAVEWFSNTQNKESYLNITNFFGSFTKLQKAQVGKPGLLIDMEGDIFKATASCIDSANNMVAMAIRGSAKFGKSSFLTILYLYLLNNYINGHFRYIPAYINLEILLNEPRDSEEFWNEIDNKIKEFFEAACRLSKESQVPICFFIDGLNQHEFFSNSLEAKIKEYEHRYSNNGSNRFVFCIDTDESIELPSTIIHREKNAEYLLYFDQISTVNAIDEQKYRLFIRNYCTVSNIGVDKADTIMYNIKRINFQLVDFNILTQFQSELINPEANAPITEMYETYLQQVIPVQQERKIAPFVAFSLFLNGKDYEELRNAENNISYRFLESIRSRRGLAYYLIARHYVNKMNEISNIKGGEIDAVLNYPFSNDITIFIRDIIECDNYQRKLISFSKNNYAKVNFKGKSTISYLISRVSNIEDIKEILSQHMKMCKKASSAIEDKFFSRVVIRSITLSEILTCADKKKKLMDYIELLIESDIDRKTNSNFYLLYYGDRRISEITDDFEIYEGFDFFHTFHILASRLRRHLTSDRDYDLMELDLFTLCDIVNEHFHECKAKRKVGNQIGDLPSLFFDLRPRIVELSLKVIECVMGLCRLYLGSHAAFNKDSFYFAHISNCLNRHTKFTAMMCDEERSAQLQYYHPSEILEELSRIRDVEKIGWKIDKSRSSLTAEEYNSYALSRPRLETVLEHMYEAYLIGVLYLPEKLPEKYKGTSTYKKYNKHIILDLILLHDIGECSVGDYPPFYNEIKDIKKKEDCYNQELFVHVGFDSRINLYSMFDLWQKWYRGSIDDINVTLAKEIDRIQMIYRFCVFHKDQLLAFDASRTSEFIEEMGSITTEIGKAVLAIVVRENPSFSKIMKTANHFTQS